MKRTRFTEGADHRGVARARGGGEDRRCVSQPRVKRLLSSEHFSVDGTFIQAWASMKSFKPKQPPGKDGGGGGGRNAPADYRGQKRSNETHQNTTDSDARLYRKGPGMEARLCFMCPVDNQRGWD